MLYRPIMLSGSHILFVQRRELQNSAGNDHLLEDTCLWLHRWEHMTPLKQEWWRLLSSAKDLSGCVLGPRSSAAVGLPATAGRAGAERAESWNHRPAVPGPGKKAQPEVKQLGWSPSLMAVSTAQLKAFLTIRGRVLRFLVGRCLCCWLDQKIVSIHFS